MSIDWQNLFKLRIANPDKSMIKHEVIKLLLLIKLLKRHSNEKNYIRIYSEFIISNDKGESKKCDLYYENIKTKEAYAFEVQTLMSERWLKNTKDFYSNWHENNMRTSDLIIIPLKKLSNNLDELNRELNDYII
jgi:hypothetical protein